LIIYFQALNLTYLPLTFIVRDGIGTFSFVSSVVTEQRWGEVVKASAGHYPLPFLISIIRYNPDFFKELGANIAWLNEDNQTFFD
jgi:hypothetical protein